MSELLYAMFKTKNNSPGPDNIHIKMIKNMPDRALVHVLNIITIFGNKVISLFSGNKQPWYLYQSQINLTQILPIIVLLP